VKNRIVLHFCSFFLFGFLLGAANAFSSPVGHSVRVVRNSPQLNLLDPQSFHPACRLFPTDSDISSRGQ